MRYKYVHTSKEGDSRIAGILESEGFEEYESYDFKRFLVRGNVRVKLTYNLINNVTEMCVNSRGRGKNFGRVLRLAGKQDFRFKAPNLPGVRGAAA